MIVLRYSDVTCRAADPVERDRQEDTAHWYTCLSVQLSVPLTSSLSVCLSVRPPVCLSPVCLSVSSGVYSLTDVVTVVMDSRGTDSGKPLPLQPAPCRSTLTLISCQLTNHFSLSLQQPPQEVPWPPVSPAPVSSGRAATLIS